MTIENWDELRLFLALVRSGSLKATGRALSIDHSTVARRLTALENAIGARLAERSPRGLALTEAGIALAKHAERIEAELLAADALVGGKDAKISGVVRLATTEAFGTYIVAPNVSLLARRHPGLELELAPNSRPVSLIKREADVAITLNRPPRGRIVARRLVNYRLGLYASETYLRNCGPVRDLSQLASHPTISYIDNVIADVPELCCVSEVAADARPLFRSSSLVAQHNAVASGLGLGLLHVFAASQDERLIRLFPSDVQVVRSYWLTLLVDQQQIPRVRAVIDFLDELVSIHRALF